MLPIPPSESSSSAVARALQISKKLRRHPSIGYATAFLCIGSASLLQWLAVGQYDGAPFLTIYPAIILTTLIGGLGPGLLGAVLAGATQFGLFIPVLHGVALASYAIDAVVCVLLIVFINRTLDLLLMDIDLEKQAKQHQYLLATELNHRIQNLFTVIQAVIRFSLPGDATVQASAVRQRLMDRLQSMSAANRAITDSMGDGVRLVDLIRSETRGFESRFELSGAAGLVMAPQMTQNISLILHELLTNALKHGALSTPQGRVSVRIDWTDSVLTLTWRERGGPPAQAKMGSGFGSRILGTFAQSFCRGVAAAYAEDGFCYTLEIDSDEISCIDPAAQIATTFESAGASNSGARWQPSAHHAAPSV
jgi:two-component sensor histidine kinase